MHRATIEPHRTIVLCGFLYTVVLMPNNIWELAPAAHYWWAVPSVGFVGAIVAVYSILANRRIARTRATLDLIERTESSEYYLRIRKSFKRLETEASTIGRVTQGSAEEDVSLRRDILAYVNHYELVAIGCEAGILDEGFYARWMRSTLVADWNIARELVIHIREKQLKPVPNAYINFEAIAKRFASGTEKGARIRRFNRELSASYAIKRDAAMVKWKALRDNAEDH